MGRRGQRVPKPQYSQIWLIHPDKEIALIKAGLYQAENLATHVEICQDITQLGELMIRVLRGEKPAPDVMVCNEWLAKENDERLSFYNRFLPGCQLTHEL